MVARTRPSSVRTRSHERQRSSFRDRFSRAVEDRTIGCPDRRTCRDKQVNASPGRCDDIDGPARRTYIYSDKSMSRVSAIVPATNQPPTLDRCLAGIRCASQPPEEVIVVDQPENGGPALARNLGAMRARGDVLVFIDADIEVHPDVFSRIRARFDGDGGLAAVFGSYDDSPAAPDVVSAFRNLLHYWVHQTNPGGATTFWAGLGAVRRDRLLLRRGGVKLAAAGVPLHALHHLAGTAAVPVGVLAFLRAHHERPRGTLLELESSAR